MSRERVFLPFTSRCVRVTASNLARLSRWRSSSWEACPVTATIVLTERFDKNSLGHTVVTLGVYVWIHGDVADVPATVQILSTVQVGSVQSTVGIWYEELRSIIDGLMITDELYVGGGAGEIFKIKKN